jgi:hypothetical protein
MTAPNLTGPASAPRRRLPRQTALASRRLQFEPAASKRPVRLIGRRREKFVAWLPPKRRDALALKHAGRSKSSRCGVFGQPSLSFELRDRVNARHTSRPRGAAAAISHLHQGFLSIQKRATMADKVVTLKLNQQQLELVDRTVANGVAPDRVSLIRLALREQAAKQATILAKAGR